MARIMCAAMAIAMWANVPKEQPEQELVRVHAVICAVVLVQIRVQAH